jgi:hypothetical protein
MRRTLITALLASLVLIPAAPASAGTLTTTNACLWNFDGLWRSQGIDITGTGAPNPVAPFSGVALTASSIHARLPDWVGPIGAGARMLKPGENEIPTKVWVALASDGTTPGVQVLALETIVRTTVTEHPDGTYTSTPIDVTIPMPDTAWSTPAAEGTAAFKQAGPGTLPTVAGGNGGASVSPKGSVFISSTFAGGAGLQLDCQPGSAPREGTSFTAAAASPFESVPVRVGAPATPVPSDRKPVTALRTTKLRVSGKRVTLALACADAACKGAVTLKYSGASLARKTTFSLAAGAKKTLKLNLTAAARRALKRKRSLLVQVKVTTVGGKTVSKRLRLT